LYSFLDVQDDFDKSYVDPYFRVPPGQYHFQLEKHFAKETM